MKRSASVVFAVVLMVLSGSVVAATRTVTLAVKNMTCPVCPITVKKALNHVPGVKQAKVHFHRKEAVVTFDDARTSVPALIKATTDAGYPSVEISR